MCLCFPVFTVEAESLLQSSTLLSSSINVCVFYDPINPPVCLSCTESYCISTTQWNRLCQLTAINCQTNTQCYRLPSGVVTIFKDVQTHTKSTSLCVFEAHLLLCFSLYLPKQSAEMNEWAVVILLHRHGTNGQQGQTSRTGFPWPLFTNSSHKRNTIINKVKCIF